MASTNHTANLGLSQWLASDAFTREDLNGDFAKIDGAFSHRPEIRLLRESNVTANNVNQVEIDVSDLKLGDCFMYILHFANVPSCSLYIDGREVANCVTETKFFFFPMGKPRESGTFIRLRMDELSGGYSITGFNLSKICPTASSGTLNGNVCLRIWGVK